MIISTVSSEEQASGWAAKLELWLEKEDGETRLVRRLHNGPLRVQRPFYPERDGTCHVYLLHPPGGVVGGDVLNYSINLGARANCLLTTPGATKFYRTASEMAQQNTVIDIGQKAICEYFPQETIIFRGANALIENTVNLADGGQYLGWDINCLGRPASGERFDAGRVRQKVEIFKNRRLVWRERIDLQGRSPCLTASYGLSGRTVFGTLVYVGQLEPEIGGRIDEIIGSNGEQIFSVSQLEEVLVCRYLGDEAEECKWLFTRAWNEIRMLTQLKPAVMPRIWST